MGFKDYTIEECCEILNNLRFPLNSEQRFEMKGEYPYYGANGVQGYINKWRFDDDLILIAEDGGNFEQYATRPIAYRVNGKCWVNNHAHVIKAKNEFSQSFIFYSLEHKNILFFIAGGTRSKLTQSELKRIILKHPRKEEADYIGNIIQITDEAIAHTEALIAKYQRIKTGLMQDLLTKGIDENGNIRSKTTHKFVVKNGIEVPEEWEVMTLEEVCLKITDGSHFSPIPQVDGRVIGNVKDMTENSFNYLGCTKILEKDFQILKLQNCSPKKGDVLLSKDGTIGRVLYFDSNFEIVILSSIAILRPKTNVDGNYLSYILKSDFFKSQLFALESGSALKRIVLKDIRALKFPFPKLKEEQEEISSRLKQIDTLIQNIKKQLKKLQSLKTGLMQDLLSGKVRVKL